MSDFSFHDYILENTLKLEEIKSAYDTEIQSSTQLNCIKSISSKRISNMDMF